MDLIHSKKHIRFSCKVIQSFTSYQFIDVPFNNNSNYSIANNEMTVRDIVIYNTTFTAIHTIESDSSIYIVIYSLIASESLKELILSKRDNE